MIVAKDKEALVDNKEKYENLCDRVEEFSNISPSVDNLDIGDSVSLKVSLSKHHSDVVNEVKRILDNSCLENICGMISDFNDYEELSAKRLRRIALIAATYHDVGKAYDKWQDNPGGVNHSVRSAFYLYSCFQDGLFKDLNKRDARVVMLCILHHHTSLSSVNINPRNVNVSYDSLVDSIHDSNMDELDYFVSCSEMASDLDFRNELEEIRKDDVISDISLIVNFVISILVQADQHASSRVSLDDKAFQLDFLDESDFNLFSDLRPFQERVSDNIDSDNLVGIAGCGEGKTHAALQFARQKVRNGEASRVIFAMSTRTVSNNLLREICMVDKSDGAPHVDKNKCGIYHSSSDITIDEEDEEDWDLDKAHLKERARKWMMNGVTVTTVDHLVKSLVNSDSTSHITKGNILDSVIVFDEIHAYDDYTVKNILDCIKFLDEVGIPHYITTATLPSFIERELESIYDGSINKIESKNENEKLKFRKEKATFNSDNILDCIDDNVNKAMVVCNTVSKAKEISRDLMKKQNTYEIIYYSSEFCKADREKKENEIMRRMKVGSGDDKVILICTQVCEISMDITSDVMISEIAPIDSILQRAGRLHREGSHFNSKECDCDQCKIRKSEIDYEFIGLYDMDNREHVFPYYDGKDNDIMEVFRKTNEIISKELVYTPKKSYSWLDEVYSDYKTGEISSLYWKIREDLLFGKNERDISIRKQEINRINLLAGTYVNEQNKINSPKTLFEEKNHSPHRFYQKYSVPIKMRLLNEKNIERRTICIGGEQKESSNFKYSYKKGLQKPNKQIKKIID